ncbi:MAG: hypothetical protein RIK87_27310 [Fuerstiella sp.]
MKISQKTLLTAAIALGTTLASFSDAEACGRRRSSGYSGGYSSYSRSHSYGYNRYSHYQQPIQVVQPVQPIAQQQQIAPQPFVQQQPVAPQPLQQPVAAPQTQLQPVAPQTQSQTQLQPQTTPTPQNAPVQPNSSTQPQAPANAQLSALQALGGFAPPATPTTQPQPQPQTPVHVGTWSASLGNGATVRLVLNSDGTFTWSATNKAGSTSSFSGSYTVSNGTLTLNRSNDNQQLAGNFNTSGNDAFSFKVAGNNAAAINFARS